MSDKILLNETVLKETLSALLDHEAGKTDALELRRLARTMEHDPELARYYQRLRLGSTVMRGEVTSIDLLSRIRQAIDEPVTASAVVAGSKAWWKTASQFAVAASVAVIAIWYVQASQVVEIAPVVTAEAAPENKKLGINADNRLLNSRVLTVSAGNNIAGAIQNRDMPAGRSTDCIITEQELPADSGLRQLQLPDGYVLCRMDENRQRCYAVSASLACYPR